MTWDLGPTWPVWDAQEDTVAEELALYPQMMLQLLRPGWDKSGCEFCSLDRQSTYPPDTLNLGKSRVAPTPWVGTLLHKHCWISIKVILSNSSGLEKHGLFFLNQLHRGLLSMTNLTSSSSFFLLSESPRLCVHPRDTSTFLLPLWFQILLLFFHLHCLEQKRGRKWTRSVLPSGVEIKVPFSRKQSYSPCAASKLLCGSYMSCTRRWMVLSWSHCHLAYNHSRGSTHRVCQPAILFGKSTRQRNMYREELD